MSFKVERFVADDVAIEKNQVEHFAIVESCSRDHERRLGVDITADRPRAVSDPEIRYWVILQHPIAGSFSSEDEVAVGLVGHGAKLTRERNISVIEIAWRRVTM